jgi:hypothetical protein
MIEILSLISLIVFVLGSLAYRMIGVETLYTIQITWIVQTTSKYYNSFFVNFEKLNLSYGQISHFTTGSNFVSSNFSKLGYRTDLNDNYLLLAIINGFTILLFCILFLYRLKLKLEIFFDNPDDEKKLAP